MDCWLFPISYRDNWQSHLFAVFCLFVIRNRIFPAGSTPKGGPTETTLYHPGHSSPPGLVSVSVPSPPILLSWMPLASGPYPPLSSCPIHIPYRVSGLFLPCLSVLHIYSNPTEKNPSTNIKPHIQTVLIHYFNKQTIRRAVYHYLVSPPVSSVPTCSSAPHLHQWLPSPFTLIQHQLCYLKVKKNKTYMYTSTPLLFLPFSLQHFFLLPSSFSPRFAPLFPLIILQMFHPLSFYHPHLSLSPHASVTFISIFCLFPPSPSSSVASLSFSPPSSFLQASPPVSPLIILQMFHPLSFYHHHLSLSPHASVTFISIFCLFPPFSILLRCFSLFLSSLLFPSSFSPRFRSRFPSYHPPDVPSSFLLSSSPLSFPPCFRHFYLHLLPLSPLLHPPPLLLFVSLLPPLLPWKFFSSVRLLSFTLFRPLFYSLPTFVLFFPTSLPLSSQSILLSPVLSLLLSPPIHCPFPQSLVWSF